MSIDSAAPPTIAPIAIPSAADLAQQVHARLGWAADTGEVAAVLESTGINDRAAGTYGHPSVFTLARQILTTPAQPHPAPEPAPQTPRIPIIDALVRAGLFLTPTVIVTGSAPLFGTLPWYATTGPLVAGWATAQALAFLGYQAVNEAGVRCAARRLALGFATLALLWAALLAASGASTTSYLVSAAQIMLFAANTAALVTGTERRTLIAAASCWLATAALLAGTGPPAVAALLAGLLAMVTVAYLPAWGRGTQPWRPDLNRYAVAARHGTVGAGQALLFILVALQQTGTIAPAATSAPLLVGIPLTELMLLRHQRRVADGRVRLTDRTAFRRHLARTGTTTGLALAVPPLAAAALLLSTPTPDGWAVTASTLLAGINAICLVLVAHRRPASALALIWLSAALIALSITALRILLPNAPDAATASSAVILLCLYPPALAEAVRALKDPWSYR
ncbi:hypothetical protein [Catellatospora sichuanensis]|uniref:hypothetical protein n=1 Tax=Catellatospora sichuanensis TaxID=1969805 RepID=UPI0016426B61|nr:hypothetical protein [Catellatospora sichuanensis]